LDTKYHSCTISDKLIIECDKNPNEYGYISEMELNGARLKRPYITYSEITGGGILKFFLSKNPDVDFGNDVSLEIFGIN